MLAKNTMGIIILVLNTAGLGYLLYVACLHLMNYLSTKKALKKSSESSTAVKTGLVVIDDTILPEEDDLLKDMDLSDLDNLNLDDFE